MTIETFLAIFFFAVVAIGCAVIRLTETKRVKYVDQKAKTGGETKYVFVLYI